MTGRDANPGRFDAPARAHYDDDAWFPINWDRRSRDGWIRARNARALDRARLRPIDWYSIDGAFGDEDDGEEEDDDAP